MFFGSMFQRKRTVLDRLSDRAEDLAERATGSAERAGDAAARIGRRAGAGLGQAQRVARERAESGREAVAERLDRLARRAAEIREQREWERRERMIRAHERQRATLPLRLDVRESDRVILRGVRPVDVRTPDGEIIQYRYGPRPGPMRRLLWRLRGREVRVLE